MGDEASISHHKAIIVTPNGLCHDDPVWARLDGWPAWPARIISTASLQHLDPCLAPLKENHVYVVFFNWNNDYAQIPANEVLPYAAYTANELHPDFMDNPDHYSFNYPLRHKIQVAIRAADAYLKARSTCSRWRHHGHSPGVQEALQLQVTHIPQATPDLPSKATTSPIRPAVSSTKRNFSAKIGTFSKGIKSPATPRRASKRKMPLAIILTPKQSAGKKLKTAKDIGGTSGLQTLDDDGSSIELLHQKCSSQSLNLPACAQEFPESVEDSSVIDLTGIMPRGEGGEENNIEIDLAGFMPSDKNLDGTGQCGGNVVGEEQEEQADTYERDIAFTMDFSFNAESRRTVATEHFVDIVSLNESEKVAFIVHRENLLIAALQRLGQSEDNMECLQEQAAERDVEIEKIRTTSLRMLSESEEKMKRLQEQAADRDEEKEKLSTAAVQMLNEREEMMERLQKHAVERDVEIEKLRTTSLKMRRELEEKMKSLQKQAAGWDAEMAERNAEIEKLRSDVLPLVTAGRVLAKHFPPTNSNTDA